MKNTNITLHTTQKKEYASPESCPCPSILGEPGVDL